MRPEAALPAAIAALPLQDYNGRCYRIVDFATLTGSMIPLYTLGPGKNGQRYTPKFGPNALYVAEDIVTAQAEYHRVSRAVLVADPSYHVLANPTVQLTIQVNLERVLDLTDRAVLAALETTIDELTGPWRKQMIKKLFCPTQVVATAAYANGTIQAMRYPSAFGHDFSNLIIWEERIHLPSFVQVRDTNGILTARMPPKRPYRKRRP
ncbi:MAG: RES family NAD+ phosphorylase [Candidatus Obscuribacterales bacterium]|nr:RES family NAD+ phosphorylase [Candidatus Obscuribacterales bacterium]